MFQFYHKQSTKLS